MIEEIENNIPPHLLFKELSSFLYSFFLDSAIGHDSLGRFSFIGCEPFLVFRSKKDSLFLEWNDGRIERIKSDPFFVL
ncbi:MAG: aminodeoxychorismate synthase, component I, partial [Candidatus Omnitrophota bacterium]|nr:aminodeoxychorismate synthase, component I [Candidatus Omnitrophota bacterium]